MFIIDVNVWTSHCCTGTLIVSTSSTCMYMYTCTLYVLHVCVCVIRLCDALVEVLWLLCIVYVIRDQPAELPR